RSSRRNASAGSSSAGAGSAVPSAVVSSAGSVAAASLVSAGASSASGWDSSGASSTPRGSRFSSDTSDLLSHDWNDADFSCGTAAVLVRPAGRQPKSHSTGRPNDRSRTPTKAMITATNTSTTTK